jgi:uncharacterized protein YggE
MRSVWSIWLGGVAVGALLALPGCVKRADAVRPRTITVVGESVLHVPPDRFVLHAGVEYLDRDLNKAWAQVAAASRRIAEAARAFPIDAQRTHTAYLTVDPEYNQGNFLGYKVQQGLQIFLTDLSRRDELVVAVFEAGANDLSIDFSTEQDRQELREQAREAAVRDARQKAERMAAVLGDRVGAALQVGNPGAWQSEGVSLFQTSDGSAEATDSMSINLIAPTEVEIEARVLVRFALIGRGPR